ncbi:hypothetical protein [Phocaeicola coprocola]|uniref:hypothetical protein n=1 Tax=Phocaeicola coprocola TaxID=310298 RepID=UPI004024F933
MIIAVDFDGTIVEHKYPSIGKEIPFAIETLKKLQAERHKLILWSVREGRLLDEAVQFCHERGLDFYAINQLKERYDYVILDTAHRYGDRYRHHRPCGRHLRICMPCRCNPESRLPLHQCVARRA